MTEDGMKRRLVLLGALGVLGTWFGAVGPDGPWRSLLWGRKALPGKSLELELTESIGVADSLQLSELTFAGKLSVGVELSQPRIIT